MRLRPVPTRSGSVLVLSAILAATGCAQYVTPGGPADLTLLGSEAAVADAQAPYPIQQALERKPMAQFPASVMVVRVQAGGYRSPTATGYGSGNYCVVTTRDVESEEHLKRLAERPGLAGIAPAGRLLLPTQFNDDRELRQAAARLQADMVLVYTLDTDIFLRDMAKPLSVVTLGLSPNQKAYVTTTASSLLLDTRTGYVYGLAEATDRTERLASAWTNEDAVDAARLATERAAFDKLVDELIPTWDGIVARYAGQAGAGASSPVQ